MSAGKPRTTGSYHVLPFQLLSPDAFERMCLWLIEREGFERIEHVGDAGADGGCDLRAWKDDQLWIVQCKNVQSFALADAESEIEKIGEKEHQSQSFIILFIVACRVSERTRLVAWDAHRNLFPGRVVSVRFWARTELDERIKRHGDIVEEFFQINSSSPTECEIATSLITYLEDKRIIFDFRGYYGEVAHRMIDYPDIQESIQSIRRRLTTDMENVARSSPLFDLLQGMRNDCRQYLTDSPPELAYLRILLEGADMLRLGLTPTPEAKSWRELLGAVDEKYGDVCEKEARQFNDAIVAFRKSILPRIKILCSNYEVTLDADHQKYLDGEYRW